MSNQLQILNVFGIKPTNTAQSAGMDFYIPNLDKLSDGQKLKAIEALKKSYKVSDKEWNDVWNAFGEYISAQEDRYSMFADDVLHLRNNRLNFMMFYFGLDSMVLKFNGFDYTINKVDRFIEEYVTFDDNGVLGLRLQLNDALFINSGIKVALQPGTMGMFANKSGMANRGYDVRSCIVDEDYCGFVHLSAAYTKEPDGKQNIIYAGDKLLQMIIVPVFHSEPLEITESEYDHLMQGSERGAQGFGHSDVKH